MLPAVVLVHFALVPIADMGSTARLLVRDLGALALGLAVYGAVFALIGAVVRRPLVIGLVFAFGWEPLALVLPGYLRRATIAYYLQALVPHAPPADGPAAMLQSLFADTPPVGVALFGLLFALAVSLVLAVRAVSRREYVLEQ